MKLKEILNNTTVEFSVSNNSLLDLDINFVTSNSKKVNMGFAYVAIKGTQINGTDFIEEAILSGAEVIIVNKNQKDISTVQKFSDKIVFVDNERSFLSQSLFLIYKNIQPEYLLSVTGTNGKSSTAFFVSQMLNHNNIPNMVIGTLGVYIDGKKEIESLTTPSPEDLVRFFNLAKARNIKYVIMESSSHGIEQRRIEGLHFSSVGWTNLSQDHLDYHGDYEEYFQSKHRLFKEIMNAGSSAIINCDDSKGKIIAETCKEKGINVTTYGFSSLDFKIKNISINNDSSQKVEICYLGNTYNFNINLMGTFQVYNILCATGILVSCGFKIEDLIEIFPKIQEIDGRLNYIPNSQNLNIFIDFAHTPNALEQVIQSLKEDFKNKEIVVLFGCGGNRDAYKRKIMGKIAAELSSIIYVTDDNPRYEDPENIRKEIMLGIKEANNRNVQLYEIADRKEAITAAVQNITSNQVLLIAGKGHEKVQIVQGETIEFNDKECVKEALKNK